jgi:FMN phosphatase YigB (HAD superfamily)
VILDLGRVLLDFDFQRGYRRSKGVARMTRRRFAGASRPADLVERFETGLIEPPTSSRSFPGFSDLDMDYAGFCRLWSSIFTDPLIPEAMLEGLAARYRLVLLSNTNAIHFEMIRENYRRCATSTSLDSVLRGARHEAAAGDFSGGPGMLPDAVPRSVSTPTT